MTKDKDLDSSEEERNLQHNSQETEETDLQTSNEDQANELISNEALLGIYAEILGKGRKEDTQVQELIDVFSEMVLNEGDASNASKEALVNLVKIKADLMDKMTKIADLMTRIKLKEKNTMPDALKAKYAGQNNVIDQSESNRTALENAINKSNKDKKDKKNG